jgi:hypothetical protein
MSLRLWQARRSSFGATSTSRRRSRAAWEAAAATAPRLSGPQTNCVVRVCVCVCVCVCVRARARAHAGMTACISGHVHSLQHWPTLCGLRQPSICACRAHACAHTHTHAHTHTGQPATEEELIEWGGELGSDVSFFLSRGTAYCTGRGEIIQHLPALPTPPGSFWVQI